MGAFKILLGCLCKRNPRASLLPRGTTARRATRRRRRARMMVMKENGEDEWRRG